MADLPHATVTLDGITRPDGWAPIRRLLGIRSFGVNAWTATEAGGQVIPDHEEGPTGHEELYVVINGHAFFKVGEEVIDGPTGTILLVRDPLMIRGATATNPGTTILTAGGAPGKAYTPHPWETNRDVLALFEVGDFGQARQYSPPHLRNTRSGRSCSTTSPAPRQSSATTTRRSATCQRRSAATLSSPNTRPPTTT